MRCLQCFFEVGKTEFHGRLRDAGDEGIREVDIFVVNEFLLPVLYVECALVFIGVVKVT